jgi:hypothetical protein
VARPGQKERRGKKTRWIKGIGLCAKNLSFLIDKAGKENYPCFAQVALFFS